MRRTIFQMKCEPPTRIRIRSPSSRERHLLDEDVSGFLVRVIVAEGLEVVHAGKARRRVASCAPDRAAPSPTTQTVSQTRCAVATPGRDSCAQSRCAARETDAARCPPRARGCRQAGASLMPRRSDSAGSAFLTSRCATCRNACTPASVRPDPMNSNVVSRVNSRDRAFELALHGARVLLFLPAAVFCSGEFDCELVTRH